MKSIEQQLVETADSLSLHSTHTAKLVKTILAENAGKNLEVKLNRLVEMKKTLITETVRKHNGASDNAGAEFIESASDNSVGRDALIAAAMKSFPELCPTKEAAAAFASDRPVNKEVEALHEAVLNPKPSRNVTSGWGGK
ncbi:MAG: hypothetical protein WA213_21650 [Terriglobales bacterium]